MSTETYVGPYVRCFFQMVYTTEERRTCPNLVCLKHGQDYLQGKFCDGCGSELRTMPRIVKQESVDYFDVSEAINERLCGPHEESNYHEWSRENKTHIWLPNQRYVGEIELPEDGFYAKDLVFPDIVGEVTAFRNAFAHALGILQTTYGDEAVSIHWGIIGG